MAIFQGLEKHSACWVCGDLTCFLLSEEICQITVQLLFFMSLPNRIVYFLIYFLSIQRLLLVISALSDMQMLMKLTPALEETDTPLLLERGEGEANIFLVPSSRVDL